MQSPPKDIPMAPGRWYCPCFRPETDDVTVLEYSHFNLDDVPSEVFSFERTLEELYLDANQIKDLPRPLFHCHGLRKLILSDNEVQSLPPAIASLINLEELDISKNGILEIPDNINGCKRLISIEASVNPLGRLPEGFTQLINLEELYLNDTFLEYLPANFGRLCHLRILELRENHLKVLPKSITRLSELTRLDIGQNDFVELPEVVGSLSKLTELWCDGNRILKVPPCLGNLKKLGYLDASKNKIHEVAPEIDGCIFMTDLTLSHNKIKHLPHTLGNLKKLSVLHIENNHVTSIPPSIGNLQCLEELVMSNNNVRSLPVSFGLLRNLHTFLADDNCIESLPREIGSCVSLSILSLRNNRLTFVPDEIGHIARLRVVNLVSNHLCNLPFSIAKLPNLHALWLSENQAKPLIPLQSDVDAETGQRVLTCFMLPQSPLEQTGMEPTTPDSEAEREGRQQIKFSSDIEGERPGKLVRAPTPYPKELKAHARHARNFVLKKLEANGTYVQYPVEDKSPSDDMEPDSIRDELAKVNDGGENVYRNPRHPETDIRETGNPEGPHHRLSESPAFPSLRSQDPEQTVRKWEESCLNSVVREDGLGRQEKVFSQDRNPSPSQVTKQLKKQFFDGLPTVHQNMGSGNYSPEGRKYYCHPSYNSSTVQMKNAVPTSTNSFVQRGPRFSSPVSQTAPLSLTHKLATMPTSCGTYPPPRAGSHISHSVDVKSDSCLDSDRPSQALISGQRKSYVPRSAHHQPSPQQGSGAFSHSSSPVSQSVTSPKPYPEMGYRVSEPYPGSQLNTDRIAWYTGPNVPPRDGPVMERPSSEIEYKRQSLAESDSSASHSFSLNNSERSRSYRSLESGKLSSQ